MTKTRTLLDGRTVIELEEALTLPVRTKCPEKWLLIDLETGERYTGYTTPGSLHWKKLETCRTLT
jgi:hypothetical protein